MNLLLLLRVLQLRKAMVGRERWPRTRMGAFQEASLRTLRKVAYAKSPFYQKFHKGLHDRPLIELPVLTKAHLMEHFDEVVTDRRVRLADVLAHVETLSGDERYLGKYWVSSTSGSTGRRGLFLSNFNEWATVIAGFSRAVAWSGVHLGLMARVKEATVASTTPWHMSARTGLSVASRFVPTLHLDADRPLGELVMKLNEWQPDLLIAYASMASLLAEEQLAQRLHIQPRAVFSSSEVLTEEMRRHVEQAWGRRLFNEYAATESGMLASECEQHAGLHVYEDTVILEVVDAEGRPVPPGSDGARLLLTVLFNQTQPLIRYELTDLVRPRAGTCPCGRTLALIDEVSGRLEEVLHLSGRDMSKVAIHPNVFHALLEPVDAAEWQVTQEEDRLVILLAGSGEGDASLAARVRQRLEAAGALAPHVVIQRVASIPRGPGGKAPLIKAHRSV